MFYVLGRRPVDVAALARALEDRAQVGELSMSVDGAAVPSAAGGGCLAHVMVFYDVQCLHAAQELGALLKPTWPNLQVATLQRDFTPSAGAGRRTTEGSQCCGGRLDCTAAPAPACVAADESAAESHVPAAPTVPALDACSSDASTPLQPGAGIAVSGQHVRVPAGVDMAQCTLLFIGQEVRPRMHSSAHALIHRCQFQGPKLTNLIITLNKCPCLVVDPEASTLDRASLEGNQQLMKRCVAPRAAAALGRAHPDCCRRIAATMLYSE